MKHTHSMLTKMMAFLFTLAMLLSLCACADAQKSKDPAAAGMLANVTGSGGLGDQGLNDYIYAGVKTHEADGVTVDVVQPSSLADIPNLQKLYAQSGKYATIVCSTYDNVEALKETAPQFPNQSFVICDAAVDAPNVASVVISGRETGFQLGIVAGMMVKSDTLKNTSGKNTIAFVGGMDQPSDNEFCTGFTIGAKLVNPDVTVLRAYVGSFADPSAAEEIATGLYNQGADIIFPCAGGSALGVFSAAQKAGKYALGVEVNQNSIAPDNIIASAIRDWKGAVASVTQDALDGTLTGGTHLFGIADNAIHIDCSESNVPAGDDVLAKVEELSAKVADGTYELPSTLDAVESFLAANAN